MSQRRNLKFSSEADAVADIERLRRGHVAGGTWTLAQCCWHIGLAPNTCLHMPASLVPNDAERKMQGRLDELLAAGVMPRGLPIAPGTEPPDNLGDKAIDECIAAHHAMAGYDKSHVSFGPFGPVEMAKFRAFVLIHDANHLGFFEPKPASRRVGLSFAGEEAIIADLHSLQRNGYAQTGGWTLAQIAWHLNATTAARMNPSPDAPYTDEQRARRPQFEQVLATGTLPAGLPMPEAFRPPTTFESDPVDELIATLERFKTYAGPFGYHRLFGPLSGDEARRINRIHSAHHLSHLVPTVPHAKA